MNKRISLILLLALIFGFVTNVSAQALYDGNNRLLGTIDESGTVYNSRNSKVGSFADGNIYNASGSLLGSISTEYKIYDGRNRKIGHIDDDNNVYDANNKLLGFIDDYGTVYDAKKRKIGKFEGVYLDWAAVFYFYGFFKL